MNIYTIGFTKKSASRFFSLLRESGVKRIVDVRLNNASQLAGFAKKDDLSFFLDQIGGIGYEHIPELAPEKEMLANYRKNHKDWTLYEKQFLDLMYTRKIEDKIPKDVIAEGCLLCSEDKPHHCHRRLVAEYLSEHWGEVVVKHLV